jgi:hypothetical protein
MLNRCYILKNERKFGRYAKYTTAKAVSGSRFCDVLLQRGPVKSFAH